METICYSVLLFISNQMVIELKHGPHSNQRSMIYGVFLFSHSLLLAFTCRKSNQPQMVWCLCYTFVINYMPIYFSILHSPFWYRSVFR